MPTIPGDLPCGPWITGSYPASDSVDSLDLNVLFRDYETNIKRLLTRKETNELPGQR